VGLTLLRCLLVLGVLTVPVAAAWYFAEHVFLLLGVEEAVSAVVGGYLRVRVFSLPADVLNESFSKYVTDPRRHYCDEKMMRHLITK